MAEMGRQDKECLDKRDEENNEHDQGYVTKYFAHNPGHKVKGHEGDDVGEHGKSNRHSHFPCTGDGGIHT